MRSSSDIRASITAIVASAGALQTQIHEVALECLAHAQEHGDVTLIDKLVKELPKGQRIEALKAWTQDFSPIRWGGDDKVGLLKEEAKTYTPFNLDEAARVPYYQHTVEKQVTQLSLEQLMNIVNGLSKRIDRAEENGAIAEGENADAMRAYVKQLEGIKPVVADVIPMNDESEGDDTETLTEETEEQQTAEATA